MSEREMTRQPDLLTDGILKLYTKYLVPSISATLVTSIYILADTIMIGQGIGPAGIAALNILLPVFNLFFATGALCGVGGSVLFSVSLGRGEEKNARLYFTAAMVMAVCFSVFYVAFFHLFFGPVTRFMGSSEGMEELVASYGRILVTGAPAFLFSGCLQAFVRNDKAPKLAMVGVITGGLLNVGLDYVFIFIFHMGMAGASLASVLSVAVTVLILLTRLLSPESNLKLAGRPSFAKVRNISLNGFSSFLLELSGGVVIFLFNRQLLRYVGELGVVAYGIVSNSALVVSSISNGVSQAVQPILAVNFGAGHRERVAKTRNLGLLTAVLIGVFFTVFGCLRPEWLIYAFVKPTEEIVRMGTTAIRLYFLSFLAAGVNMLLSTYFQSVLKPGGAFAISLLRGIVLSSLFVMMLPLAFGVDGIWMTMVFTEGLTLAVALILLGGERRGKSTKFGNNS